MRTGWGLVVPLVFAGMLAGHYFAGPAHAAVVAPRAVETGSVIVTAGTAEVREAPSPRAKVLAVVEKGDIFLKQGRTGRWYYIKLDEDTFGWVSGRAIRRYQAPEPRAARIGPTYDRYYPSYPYYPDDYYGYPYYWERPYLSWEWYLYDYEPYRGRSYYYYQDDHRDRNWRGDGRRRDEGRRDNDGFGRRRRSGPDHVPAPPFRIPPRRR